MKYRIAVPIKFAEGFQYFIVEAESKSEALDKFSENKAIFETEEMFLIEIGDPDEDDVELV
jgi:hypothetical protein